MEKKTISTKSSAPVALQPLFNFPLRAKYIFLAVIGLVFYGNSLFNEYAFDDRSVILQNIYVQMGFSGIPKLLTHDSYQSYDNNSDAAPSEVQLSGGRFRPLSEIIFAIEQSVLGGFGDSTILPYFRHLVNIVAYMACIIALFYFLEKFLLKKTPGGSDIAFLSTLLFAIHPIHTEVVANIKSLDEILSFLFIMLTFIFSLKYLASKKTKHLFMGAGSFLLALLSKEYAVLLVFFIPFLFYLLENRKPSSAIMASVPYYGILVIYLVLRFNAVGFHINKNSEMLLYANPYLYATYAQKIATKWFILGKYLGLLFFPYPLACDYSYNQIPYRSFSDITALLSMLVYTGIFVWGIILARKKSILSFAVFFFLFTVFMISNFVLNIGATLGERLIFHASFGFVIILSYYLFQLITKVFGMPLKVKKSIVIGIMSVIVAVCFGETVIRNAQWKNDASLIIHDVRVVPGSFLVNNNAGWCYMMHLQEKGNTLDQSKAYLDSARKYLLRAVYFNPKNVPSYYLLGIAYIDQRQLDSARYCWDMVEKLDPAYPGLQSNYVLLGQQYYIKGLNLTKQGGNRREAISYMQKALSIDSTNADIWYNIGATYYQLQRYDSAKYSMIKALQYKPDYVNAKKGLEILSQMK